MSVFRIIRDRFPIQKIHCRGDQSFEEIAESATSFALQHRKQVYIDEIELLAFAGTLPAFRPKDCSRSEFLAVTPKVVV